MAGLHRVDQTRVAAILHPVHIGVKAFLIGSEMSVTTSVILISSGEPPIVLRRHPLKGLQENWSSPPRAYAPNVGIVTITSDDPQPGERASILKPVP